MLGAIVGDIVGSRFEGQAGPLPKDFEFWAEGVRFTDDTVCTVAVADCLLDESEDFAEYFRKWVRIYPDRGYGQMFLKWALADDAPSYGSYGNGAVMRVAPVAWAAKDAAHMVRLATAQARVSHDHPDALEAAVAVAGACFLALQGGGRRFVRDWVEERFGYDLRTRHDALAADPPAFDITAKGTARLGLISALWASSAEEAIRNAVSLGGDTDTTAAVAGAVGQALYGLDHTHQNAALDRLETPLESTAMLFRAQY